MLRVSQDVVEKLRALQNAWRAFFGKGQKYKDTYRTVSLKGTYMTPFPGVHEAFEHKHVNRDANFRCPPECEAETEAVFEWCQTTAMRLLRLMLEHRSAAGWKWTESDYKPESTLRILHYDGANPRNDASKLEDAWPEHTDSSLVTIAPRSSMPALEMKRFDTNEWVSPEDGMQDDQVVVFMGDSGAYLTNNYFPSPIHRPGVKRMLEAWKPDQPTRMSTPFFLRGTSETVLRPQAFDPACSLPPLKVGDLDDNIGLCRDRMPWKIALPYYASMTYSK